ncbi:hypothetical protein [Limnofasciculus baicalensis]|uniref:Uncharacterized protein n=1 Tax=Limnofasciculus baicalensis BBK-W-15 TaxID=2699891 RepID=A0AAE3KPW5_9CYAN|nr:hypothetical protein [Limnofasciculus baicalensis]MCP2731955.1 hypothetical protein [Limnofasciculus baicalensis BBK-W-15]
MTLEEIDQLIADWRTKIDLVSHDLMDLHGLSTYQRLAGEAGFPQVQLTGITEMEVNPALEAMNELFQHFNLLLDVIDSDSLPLISADEMADQLIGVLR